MRKVRNQSATLLAEYRYNGLGFMIGVHEDTDADGDADGSDKWFYPAYDEGWREVARFRESDTSPKEQFVNATAGLDGYGRSSYINDVVCRNRDANAGSTSASDGVLEERYYYCPNWHGDVSALVTSSRQLHEWAKYSAYGVPNSRPGADTNSDGDCDAADVAQIQAWIDTPAYDVRADVTLDGALDATDKTLASSAPIAGAVLAWQCLTCGEVANRASTSGSVDAIGGTGISARHRSLDSLLGRWLTRDPLASPKDTQRYLLASANPLVVRDATGLFGVHDYSLVRDGGPQPGDTGDDCHAVNVEWMWFLKESGSLIRPREACNGGDAYIVQHIFAYDHFINDCSATPLWPPREYWEAFEFPADELSADIDTWRRNPAYANSVGVAGRVIWGEAEFICKDFTGDLAALWGFEEPFSGDAPSTLTQPSFWGFFLDDHPNGFVRETDDCCNGGSAGAGGRALRFPFHCGHAGDPPN